MIKSNSFKQLHLSQLFHYINKDLLIENGFSWIKLILATNGMNLIKVYNDIAFAVLNDMMNCKTAEETFNLFFGSNYLRNNFKYQNTTLGKCNENHKIIGIPAI